MPASSASQTSVARPLTLTTAGRVVDGLEEWGAKPVAFVSYGGAHRAVEHLRTVFAEVHAPSIRDTIRFPNLRTIFGAAEEPLGLHTNRRGEDHAEPVHLVGAHRSRRGRARALLHVMDPTCLRTGGSHATPAAAACAGVDSGVARSWTSSGPTFTTVCMSSRREPRSAPRACTRRHTSCPSADAPVAPARSGDCLSYLRRNAGAGTVHVHSNTQREPR